MSIAPTWPELLEREARQFQGFPEKVIRAEEAQMASRYALAWYFTIPGTETPPFIHFGTWRPLPVARFSSERMGCHSILPSFAQVYADFEQFLRGRWAAEVDGAVITGAEALRSAGAESVEHMLTQQKHIDYHMTMWRRYGRRVLVIDLPTFELLVHTPLPPIEARHLVARFPNFYLRLPPGNGLTIVTKGDTRPQELTGLMVSTDQPGASDEPREVGLLATGSSAISFGDVDLNYAIVGLGPDALLSEVDINLADPGWGDRLGDDPEVLQRSALTWEALPRLALGMMLYLASEHPHLEPAEPVRRQKFAEIRSPRQREAALARQEQQLSKVSRLGYIRVGRRLGEEAAQAREAAEASAGRRFSYRHYVPGFWRRQHYGKGNQLVKMVLVQGFWRGPDHAESMAVHAARVQPAEVKP